MKIYYGSIYVVFIVIYLLFGAPCLSHAGGKLIVPGPVWGTVVSVRDGDTITMDVPQWPAIVGAQIGVRVNGVDTPELNDKRPRIKALALDAKALVLALCPVGSTAELTNIQRGSFFRVVADVSCNGRDLASALLGAHLAQPYKENKQPWK